MATEKASVEGFIKFCEAQPTERPIDHTETYRECACGDYIRERCGGEGDKDGDAPDFIFDGNGLNEWLGNPDAYDLEDTYGPFTKALKGFL